MRYWLMKTEPETFSISDLERVTVEPWTGVRNYMARANMRAMTVGDPVLFYHSSTEPPGVAGLAVVARTGVVDETQFDPKSPYFDPGAMRDKPRWDCVDVRFVGRLPHYVELARIRADPELAGMVLLQRGQRLSVQPCAQDEYARIVELGQTPSPIAEPTKPATQKTHKLAKPVKRATKKPPKPVRTAKAQPDHKRYRR